MRVAIGDVVRIKQDKVVGTVMAVSGYAGGTIHVHTDRQGSRVLAPQDLEHVAHGQRPMTTRLAVASVLFLILSIVIAIAFGMAVYDLGAGLLLTGLISFSVARTISDLLGKALSRPRAIRV